MKLRQLINIGAETLCAAYPGHEAREMVLAYIEDVFGIRRHTHVLEPDRELTGADSDRALADIMRMVSGEPLQYVTGKAWFYGREFRVTSDVLIPRQETELLCREILSQGRGTMCSDAKSLRILDLCTGSGCIAWTLALEMPGASVTAADISDRALAVAASQDFTEEMTRTGAVAPEFMKADVLLGPGNCTGLCPAIASGCRQFDIIVSNPPYVMCSEKALMRKNVLDHEPHSALFVPDEDPLKFYRALVLWASALLKDEGICMVEINEALGAETAALFSRAGFRYVRILEDLSGRDRFVSFRR